MSIVAPSPPRRDLSRTLAFAAILPAVLCWVAVPVATAEDGRPLPPGVPESAVEALATIDGPTLRGPIRFLSDDLLGGRGPATPGDELTQLYLSTTMEALGLEPGAEDGGWLQPFEIVGITSEMPGSWSFNDGETETLNLKRSTDFIAASGVQGRRSVIKTTDVVFVGYGIQAPEYGWDDFKDADLEGKVLLMLNNDPDWSPELFEGERRLYYGRWTYKYESAARQGAAGAIIIHTTPSAGYPWQVVQTSWSGEQFELPAGDEPRLQVAAWVTEDAARQIVDLDGRDFDQLVEAAKSPRFKPIPLDVTTSLTLKNDLSKVETANVLGLLPGSDPELADEVVIYTAHHDHLGTAPDGDDRIYNGALDNGAGVSQLLAIAKALTSMPEPPRRSVLFAFVAAEEQGLLGSKHFAAHPTFPPGKIAAAVNFDGGNIWGKTRDITLVGEGKSTLDAVAAAAVGYQGRTVVGDQHPDKGYYYRSDQFSLAKIGVPAIYSDNGSDFIDRPQSWGKQRVTEWTSVHYHQPSDELEDDWNFDGMVDDARFGLLAGLMIANADEMPSWNPGDEFEAARKKALAEVE